ncbi:hypothetical protein [Lentzea flava]|uniref:Uncharacterized protein n=1 Tax=Lentzea flava TaxID=103732 RepID=A0ABQ2UMR2_9PSEU|nr:hypothetical protein [Lentzea flava]MCP2201852.1 hypothetical protein [Lentzea flava]GGU45126.1 hypothetical protein GCM10010178_42110 [Lentzea flava]
MEQLTAALTVLEAPFRTLVDDSGWAHASMEGLVLDLGTWWTADAATRLSPQVTFSVAFTESTRERGAVYVEGYIWLDDRPVAAGWCGLDDHVVYGPRAEAYLGVPLSPHFCRRIQQRNGTAAVLMSKHPKLLPLLRDGLPRGAVLPGGMPGPRSVGT